MSEKEEVNEINFKEDSNDNGIPDWLEFVTTYLIVGLCFYIIIFESPSESLTKWLITTSAVLAGGRDLFGKLMGRK